MTDSRRARSARTSAVGPSATGDDRPRTGPLLTEPGDFVFEGDRLVEVLVGGATFDVSAPATGRLAEKRVFLDARLQPGQVLGSVETDQSVG